MEEVIKKWELILQQDKGRDIAYSRNVIEEILTDISKVVKNCNIPPDSVSLPSDNEISQVAADEMQKDWNDLRYKEIYYEAFKDGATWLRDKAKRQ